MERVAHGAGDVAKEKTGIASWQWARAFPNRILDAAGLAPFLL
jgi:hypothetical protein